MKKYRLLPDDWSPKEIGTLVYVTDGDRILLIEKLRGHGAGLINAPGGRLEHGETICECATREIWEEVGITVSNLSLRGILRFHDIENGFDMLGYAFVAGLFTGIPRKTDEANPFWCHRAEIPYELMWDDDKLWLPHLLSGKVINAELIFCDNLLKEHDVRANSAL